jgi:hypothetical protein
MGHLNVPLGAMQFKESILRKEIEGLTVQIDSNKNSTLGPQNMLEEKQKQMEELLQERSSVIYYYKIKQTGWNIGKNALFNLRKC